jgi:hypothetical protein
VDEGGVSKEYAQVSQADPIAFIGEARGIVCPPDSPLSNNPLHAVPCRALQVLFRQMLDPQFGMFVPAEATGLLYFNRDSFNPPEEFELIGSLIGIAVYNRCARCPCIRWVGGSRGGACAQGACLA